MEPFTLDATVELLEGAIYNLGSVRLLIRIRASTYLPYRDKAQVLAVQRTEQNALSISEYTIDTFEIIKIVETITRLELMEREPIIHAHPGTINGWQELALTIKLNGKQRTYALVLHYAGMGGTDAPRFYELLQSISAVARLGDTANMIDDIL